MARSFAKLLVSLNYDRDWWALTPAARDLYGMLLIRPEISHCGVADWRPAKLASRCEHITVASIKKAAAELVAGRFIVLDEESEEVLVRTFVRNDGVLTSNPKGAGPVLRAVAGIGSPMLAEVVLDEVARLHREQPSLACWQAANGGSEMVKLLQHRGTIDGGSPMPSAPDRGCIADAVADRIGDAIEALSTADPLVPSPLSLTTKEPTTNTTTSATPSPTTIEVRDDVRRLCELLSDLVDANGAKRPKQSAQFEPCRLMLERDKHTEEQIEWLIRWSQKHHFWRTNVRSMAKLREQWDTLKLQATAVAPDRGAARPTPRDLGRPRGSQFGMNWRTATEAAS